MKYFIIAGDYSGQIKGKELIKAIKIEDSDASFYIYGSSKMKGLNTEILFDFENLKIMGFWNVLKSIFKLKTALKSCKNTILQVKPDIIILIDFAGFNLRIAEFAHNNNFKTVYFIPPKVWAWNEVRIEKLKKYVTEIFVIFKFEYDYFKTKSLYTHYFGNPDTEFLIKNHTKSTRIKNQILLMPGSRQQEIDFALPVFEALIKSKTNFNFIIAGIESLNYDLEEKYKNVKIEFNNNYQLMSESEFGFIFSGTANFEATILELPHVVCFKTNLFNYLIAKFLIKVKYISLSNLILNKKVVAELIQNEFNLSKCESILENFNSNFIHKKEQIKDFKTIKKIESNTNIYKKIAQKVVFYSKKT